MTTAMFENPSRSSKADVSNRPGKSGHPGDDALLAVLAKHDDRLLRDVGLAREDVVGPAETFWAEWRRSRQAWNL